jgi:hypothetical protein
MLVVRIGVNQYFFFILIEFDDFISQIKKKTEK